MNRRSFLQTGGAAALLAALPASARAATGRAQIVLLRNQLRDFTPQRAERQALAMAAIDAARTSGAVYADVQLRISEFEFWLGVSPSVVFGAAAGVRALVNGYWGFAAFDGMPSVDDMARIGKESVKQAATGARGAPRTVELAPTPVVHDGDWTAPIDVDPFTVSLDEKADWFTDLIDYTNMQTLGIGADGAMNFLREDRTYASTDGSYLTQRLYTTTSSLTVAAEPHYSTEAEGRMPLQVGPAQGGWECLKQYPYRDEIPAIIEHAQRARVSKAADVGRWDVVFDAEAMAGILNATIAPATQLDRAVGYRANGEGTSYLNQPLEMLGTLRVAAPSVNIRAAGSMRGGAATVQWDNEGVAPTDAHLVTNGMLTDFQTTRESATWIAEYTAKTGKPVQSNGGAACNAATMPSTTGMANMILEPGHTSETFESLVRGTKKGLAVIGGRIEADQQCLNGAGQGQIVYEIVDGKLTTAIRGMSYLFRAPEFWKNVVALGGAASVRTIGLTEWPKITRGLTYTGTSSSIQSVPAKVKEIAILDTIPRS